MDFSTSWLLLREEERTFLCVGHRWLLLSCFLTLFSIFSLCPSNIIQFTVCAVRATDRVIQALRNFKLALLWILGCLRDVELDKVSMYGVTFKFRASCSEGANQT
jgi:hypothetical protein